MVVGYVELVEDGLVTLSWMFCFWVFCDLVIDILFLFFGVVFGVVFAGGAIPQGTKSID